MSGATSSVAGEHRVEPPTDGQSHHRGGIGVGQHVNPAPSESLCLHKACQFQFAEMVAHGREALPCYLGQAADVVLADAQ